MILPMPSRMSPGTRSSFWLACVPLACLVIGRALTELESVVADRITELAGLDARIASSRAHMHALTITVPDPDGPPPIFVEQRGVCIERGCSNPATDGWLCPQHEAAKAETIGE